MLYHEGEAIEKPALYTNLHTVFAKGSRGIPVSKALCVFVVVVCVLRMLVHIIKYVNFVGKRSRGIRLEHACVVFDVYYCDTCYM